MSESVHFAELPCSDSEHKIAIATLDNAASLNALSLDMLTSLKHQLEKWHDDDTIICVLLEGAGDKAFCAGGDVRTMYRVMHESTDAQIEDFCTHFFTIEYQCDYLIHTYCKPIIAWGQGIVMGGGMGLYMGSSHKVVTPSSRLAMPEISIGLYPDVGGTWFLNRLDDGMGLFLGLTGMMVNAADALQLHLADHMVLSSSKATLLEQLQVADWDCGDDAYEVVTEMLESLQMEAQEQAPTTQISRYLPHIQRACHGENITQVVEQIGTLDISEPWLETAKNNLKQGSPISAHICYRQMIDHHNLSLADCFRLELTLSVRSALLGEFREGVRSRLIDKDGEPNWRYKSVAEVDEQVIEGLFTPLWDDENHPLFQLGHY